MKKYYNTLNLKAALLVMLASFFAFSVSAQTISGADSIPEPGIKYIGLRDVITIDTTGTFPSNTTFYLHTGGNDGFDEDDFIVSTASSLDTVFIWNWSLNEDNEDLFISAVQGAIGAQSSFGITSGNVSIDGNVGSDAPTNDVNGAFGSEYVFDYAGPRTLSLGSFDELATSSEVKISFGVDLRDLDANPNIDNGYDSLVFEYSVNDGSTWVRLEDDDDSIFFDARYQGGAANASAVTLTFTIPVEAKTASAIFRIRQGTRGNFEVDESAWYVNADNFTVTIGTENILVDSFDPGINRDVSSPQTSFNFVRDTAGGSNFRVGYPVELEATLTGIEDADEDYEWAAVFQSNVDLARFTLDGEVVSSPSSQDNGNESFTYTFEIEGDIPKDIDYNEDWRVFFVAFNGDTASLGSNRNFLLSTRLGTITEGSQAGSGDPILFSGDEVRSATTEPLSLESVLNAVITLDIDKTDTDELYDSGTEIVLEYSLDGFASATQLIAEGRTVAAISLNDTIGTGFEQEFRFDIGAISDLTSPSAQLRVRQLSNNGEDLEAWSIQSWGLSSEGTAVNNSNIVGYTSTTINIAGPKIDLDNVNVPTAGIFPGDEVTLTYSIPEGVLPDGSVITAFINTEGDFDDSDVVNYQVGTSTELMLGDGSENSITVTAPELGAGSYRIFLESNDQLVLSNDVAFPISGSTLSITDIRSNNNTTDNGVDIFYPGDDLTVDYEFSSASGVPTGETLSLEYLDYSTTPEEYVSFATITLTTDRTGSITGTFPTAVNFDNNNGSNATIRIIAGNGVVAGSNFEFVQYDSNNDGSLNADIDGDLDNNSGTSADLNDMNLFQIFDEDLIEGNNTTEFDANGNGGQTNQLNNFIGAGERSITTLPFDVAFGGTVEIILSEVSSSGTAQTVTLSGSVGGSDFSEIATLDIFSSDDPSFSESIPSELIGEDVRLKVSYNEDGAAGEFENEIEIVNITLEIIGTSGAFTSAATLETSGFAIDIRRPRVSLENITGDNTFVVGEDVEIEYTTEGRFPDNTEFALVIYNENGAGAVNGSFAPETDLSSYENIAVLATASDFGTGTFSFTVPDFVYAGDGTDRADSERLINRLEVIAYDGSGTAEFAPSESFNIDEDEDFLVIEGQDPDNTVMGEYAFDQDGDRSLLTVAYDFSGASSAILNFNYLTEDDSTNIVNEPFDVDDNINTIPYLQYSIDAGATFVNIAVEDSDLTGGYLVGDGIFSVDVPAEALTSATHFRWVQDLNLGENFDVWVVRGISVTVKNGNEISSLYRKERNEVTISFNHPSRDDYEFSLVDESDAIFPGETAEISYDPLFEDSDAYPTGVSIEYLLFDVAGVTASSANSYVIDPETAEPLRLASSTSFGQFTATFPDFLEEGSYEVHALISKQNSETEMLYVYDGAFNSTKGYYAGVKIGDIDVFLRVVRTVVDFDQLDVLYAGETVTVNIDIENDETSLAGTEGLFATLLIRDYSSGDDLVIATQEGIDPIVADLPTYVRGGDFVFEVQLSEGSALGEVGDLLGDSGNLMNLENDSENFVNQPQLASVITSPEIITDDSSEEIRFDYTFDTDDNNQFRLEYRINGGSWFLFTTVADFDATGTYTSTSNISRGNTVEWRWVILSDEDGFEGNSLEISNVSYGSTSIGNDELSPASIIAPGFLAFENDNGRGLITTRSFEVGELSNSTLLSFDLTFDKKPEDLTNDQFLVLEYSTDGGSTYTELGTFPDTNQSEETATGSYRFDVTDDMKDNASIFRFRQEE
ncbi:MAG: hypothetical protein HRT61_05500 [Ekhidna sp.]|nr:hypothetical protein [Ekhidna sp.]